MSGTENNDMVAILTKFVNTTADFVTKEQQADLGDYERVSSILQEAAMSLRQCFQQIDSLLLNVELDPKVKEQIQNQYNTSIRVLQFEDIVQQILMHSQGQKEAMVEAMVTLHRATDQMASSSNDMADLRQIVSQCQGELEAISGAHKSLSPVKQQSLASGDVELF